MYMPPNKDISLTLIISVYRLLEVLKDYGAVVSDIPENVLPLMKPFTSRVDETIKPGLTMLNWTSLNVYSCKYLCGLRLLDFDPFCFSGLIFCCRNYD